VGPWEVEEVEESALSVGLSSEEARPSTSKWQSSHSER
jgi:hypothetical protein